MKGALNRKKYVLSLLELLDDCPRKVKLLKDLAQKRNYGDCLRGNTRLHHAGVVESSRGTVCVPKQTI